MTINNSRIEVSGLTKAFGSVNAITDLSFTAHPGMVTGFLGPNGAGKTTTLRALLGLVTADAGTATIGGLAYRDLPAPTDVVGAALDSDGFHPARTGRNHLWVQCTVHGYPSRRADEVLRLVDLAAAADRPVGGYSLGMRQRLALATALLGDPDVLVLDEPANGLDPDGIAWMRRLLRRLAGEGRTLLVSSHVLTEMQHLVDAVVIIHRGRLVRQGRLSELTDGQAVVVSVRTPEPARLAAALAPDVDGLEQLGAGSLRVAGPSAAEVGQIAFRHGIEVHWLATEESSLEQVFFALTATDDDPSRAETQEAG